MLALPVVCAMAWVTTTKAVMMTLGSEVLGRHLRYTRESPDGQRCTIRGFKRKEIL